MAIGRHLPVLFAVVALIMARGEYAYRSYYGPNTNSISFQDPSTGVVDKTTGLTRPYVSFDGVRDTAGQKHAYQRMLIALALGCVVICLLGRFALLDGARLNWAATSLICLACAAYLPDLGSTLFAYSVTARLAGFTVACAAVRYRHLFRAHRFQLAACVGSIVFLAYWIGGGLLTTVDLTATDSILLEQLEAHWSLILGPADAIATRSVRELSLSYGNWSVLVAAALGRWSGPITLGEYLRLIAVLQMGFFAMLLSGWGMYSRGRWVACSIALLLSACSFHFGSDCSVLYLTPNHSAWRYLFFSVSVLAQALTLRADYMWTAIVLGLVSGLSLTHNLETGIAITAGNLICIALRALREFPRAGYLGLGVAGMATVTGGCLAVMCYGLAHLFIVGTFPSPLNILETVRAISELSKSGLTGGNVRQVEPLSLIIFGHAALVLLATAARLNRLSSRDAMRAGIAGTILVWFAYFVNRPHPEYLVVYCSLYGVLLIDAWRILTSSIWWRRGSARICFPFLIAFVALGFVVLPSLFERYLAVYYQKAFTLLYYRQIFPLPPQLQVKGVAIDGVVLRESLRTTHLKQRATYLRDHANRETSLFLTMDSFLMPRLAGYWPKTGNYDPFMGTAVAYRYEQLIARFSDPSIETIYLDQDSLAEHLFTSKNHQQLSWEQASRWLFHYLRDEVSRSYDLAATEEGWEVWKRRRPTAARPVR